MNMKLFNKDYLNNIAYIYEDQQYSYSDIYSKVTELINSNIKPNKISRQSPIIVYGHKDWTVVCSFLAALSSGSPFIPIDSSFPIGRIKEIINQANPSLILNCTNDLLNLGIKEEKISPQLASEKADLEELNVDLVSELETAYIIFTSGSTGVPKGVQIAMESLVDFVSWTKKGISSNNEVFVNHALYSFDLSVYELWTSLFTGNTLLSLDHKNNLNVRKNIQILNNYNATAFVSTPSFLDLMLRDWKFSSSNIESLSRFILCGEPLSKHTAKLFYERFPKSKLFNLYGPTEATCATTSILIDTSHLDSDKPLPIGKVKEGTKIILFDVIQNSTSCSEGEIVIIGDNVSTGYINPPIGKDSPFSIIEGKRAYRTGDLGTLDENNLLYCKGRIDRQVKIKGYRIELDEIEEKLRQIHKVSHCAIILTHNKYGHAVITACVESEVFNDGNISDLKSLLGETLPDYMIPEKIYFFDRIPINQNGKIDRKKLDIQISNFGE